VKHISVIADVSAAGESLTAYIIPPQHSASIREQFKKHHVRFETDLIKKSNAKSSISAEIFLDDVRTVFLPNLAELGPLDVLAQEIAMLSMNHRPSHINGDVTGLRTTARVRATTVAPDITQIFQVLDATLFSLLKRHPSISRLQVDHGEASHIGSLRGTGI
jgi:hypothetical protein